MASRTQVIAWSSVIAIAALAVAVFVAASFVDVIPPGAMTDMAMTETSVRVGLYVQRNHKLPADLSVLPVRDGYVNRTSDGWDQPLQYTTDSDDTFTLYSPGHNAAPSLRRTYRVHNGEVQPVP